MKVVSIWDTKFSSEIAIDSGLSELKIDNFVMARELTLENF